MIRDWLKSHEKACRARMYSAAAEADAVGGMVRSGCIRNFLTGIWSIMTIATLNLKVLPRRMLLAKEAAEYCGIPVKRFPIECGVVPVVMPSGTKLYDMRDLDAWIDTLKSGDQTGDDELIRKLRG
ncbi:hypothetical protein [Mesorhizobium sp. M0296]|uniref:hypothetical protein n=1 Tax=unclassified Mesorhizobium TaxID=325217 RepID=UPI00333AB611